MRIKGRSQTEVTGPLGRNANVNSSGHLQVSIEQDNAGVGGGIQYTEGDTDASVTGQALMFESDSTNNTLAVVNRDVSPLPVAIVEGTAAGSTLVTVRNFQTSSGASLEDSTESALRVNVVAGAAGGSTQVSIREIQTSSGTSVMDSTEGAIKVNVVAGAAGGSTQVSVRNFQTSSGASMEDSTQGSLKVSIVEGSAAGSTQVSVTDGSIRVYQSTAGDLNVTVAGYVAPTTGPFTISSLSGRVAVSPNSTVWASSAGFHFDSSGALQVTQESTIWSVQASTGPYQISSVGGVVTVSTGPFQISSVGGVVAVSTGPVQVSSVGGVIVANLQDSAGVGLVSSTEMPSTNAVGLVVRHALPQFAWYAASTAGASTSTPIASSNASKIRVYAYSITSTVATANTLSFRDGDGGTLLWPVQLQAISSAMTGANLAVSPPAYLFAASSDTALVLNVASTGVYHVGVSYFLAP